MARDGLFFERVGRLSARTGAPVTAIVLQGIMATAIACSGKYGEILNFEVTVDFISFGMTAAALVVLRRRQAAGGPRAYARGWMVAVFVLACAGIVGSAIAASPANSAIALGILAASEQIPGGDLERYEDRYRLCYVRGPEGIIIELAERIG